MKLTDAEIKEFQRLYKKEFGEEIDFEEAKEQCSDFLEFMILFFKPKNIIKY